MTNSLDDAVRKALGLAPCSMRLLAQEAGVDPSLVTRITEGERRASPETAAKIEAALLVLRDRCDEAARIIREANSPPSKKGRKK